MALAAPSSTIGAMHSYRHGALEVLAHERPDDIYKREIKRIDKRLFLECQVTLIGEAVWCIVLDAGLDMGPVTLYEWRDRDGAPLELSSGILEEARRMKRSQLEAPGELMEGVVRRNQEMIERRRRDSMASYQEIVSDMLPRLTGKRSAVLHRGVHLRRSRDKQRAKGEKV